MSDTHLFAHQHAFTSGPPTPSDKPLVLTNTPTLTARGNIEIAREISGRNGEDGAFFNTVTKMLGVVARLDHRPSKMSGGEQQRVALARAIINRPSIILPDESTGNLDSKNSDVVLNMLRESQPEVRPDGADDYPTIRRLLPLVIASFICVMAI